MRDYIARRYLTAVTCFVCLTMLLVGCSREADEGGADVQPLVAVKVARAELRDVTLTVRAPATVHPRAVAQIAARVTAPIRSLDAAKGDRVKQGEIVATLENRDLLAQIDDAEAVLQQTEANYERRKYLFDEGAIPERDLLAAKTDLEKARAHVDLVRAQLAFTKLESPFDAVITEQFLYPGDMAKPDTPIFTVMDVSVVVARAQVPESEVGKVRIGQRAVFLPTDPVGEIPDGRIRVVSADVDPARRTVEVWCDIPNGERRLHPGSFGSLRIEIATAPQSVVVPSSAVELEEGSTSGTVLVVDDENIAHRQAVECGERFDDVVRVERGLNGGEMVVVEGGYGLPDGTPVTFTSDGNGTR
jgi:RND family efflux transporter MFP subunit